jgi:hypothetical protein
MSWTICLEVLFSWSKRTTTERRPIADQIVDRIIAGDKKLYEQYAQARKEVGTRNPYASAEDSEDQSNRERAVGYFMWKWIAFERTLGALAEAKLSPDNPIRDYAPRNFIRLLNLPKEKLQQIDYIRDLRNQTVHGTLSPNVPELLEAGKILEELEKIVADIPLDPSKKIGKQPPAKKSVQ